MLAVIYRLGSGPRRATMSWVSVGAIVATVLWLAASIGFSVYTATFGNYAKTYGAFAGIVVLLFWLWISMYSVLLGAEIDAESEQRRSRTRRRGRRSRWASEAR